MRTWTAIEALPGRSSAAQLRVGEALRAGREKLRPSPSASLDAQLLLGHVLGRTRAWLLSHGEEPLSPEQQQAYVDLVRRRSEGEPVAYLRGFVEWRDMELRVTDAVLIPRPETEILAEKAVEVAIRRQGRVLVDVGTGSGAIALQLARSLTGARVYAVDVSAEALEVASWNVTRLGLKDRIELLHGNLLEPLPEPPDLVVANLPYVSWKMLETLPRDVRYEPQLALAAGPEGLDLYREMVEQMTNRGWSPSVVVEIDPRQVDGVNALLCRSFPRGRTQVFKDYAGMDRIVAYEPEEIVPGAHD